VIVTQQDKEKIMQLSERLAHSFKMIRSGKQREQWLSYFLECLSEGEPSKADTSREQILRDIKDLIDARLKAGRW
jgi:hypothetical protein